MNPCSECGGSGDPFDGVTAESFGRMPDNVAAELGQPCSRCADMPWLHWDELEPPDVTDEILIRGRFRPDPDDVIAWCFNHDQPMVWDNEQCALWEDAKPYYECDPGRIARPQRLETIE